MSLVGLQNKCRARIEEAFATAEAHYGKSIKRVPVTFSNQQRKTAGTASYRTSWANDSLTTTGIKLSNKLLQINQEVFIAETPGHEAAHIIAMELYGTNGTGHGRRWKEVMRVIGQEAKRFHNMETPTVGKVAADCACKTHYISKQRAGKLRNGTATYGCKLCGKELRLVGTVINTPKTVKPVTPVKPKTVTAGTVRAKLPKVSNASLVREYIKANYATQVHAEAAQADIIQWASELFRTRSAARSCVLANTPRAFNGYMD